MTIELALRWLDTCLGLAIAQRALEHVLRDGVFLFGAQAIAAVILVSGLAAPMAAVALLALLILQLLRFDGPYNGGADKMALLAVTCVSIAHWAPDEFWSEVALAYLAVQVLLSYVVSGWVKLRNPAWRNGQALRDVFAYSAYPVSQSLRGWSERRALMRTASWSVIALELALPLAILWVPTLIAALILAAMFHLANAVLFGLNRFFWIWVATYPAVFWMQGRIFGP